MRKCGPAITMAQLGFPRPQGARCDIGAFEGSIKRTPIPTLSEWGLIAMTAILGIVGFMVIRKRQSLSY